MKFQEWLKQGNRITPKGELVIPNHLEFENNELVIEGYPNLKELYAFSCALKKVNINAPNLKILNLNDNRLTTLDVNNIPLLETLTISDNKNLANIFGFEKLNNLEELTCFQCRLKELDCSGKKKLRNVWAANQFVNSFSPNFQGAKNLEFLDVAENNVSNLDCSNLTKLKDVSCKETFFVNSKSLESHYRSCKLFIDEIAYFEVEEDETGIKKKKLIEIKKNFEERDFSGSISAAVWEEFFEINIKDFNEETNFSKEEVYRLLFPSLNANFENCTSLERLNFAKSNIRNLNVTNCRALKGVIGGWMNKKFDLDKKGNKQYLINSRTKKQETKTRLVKIERNLKNERWYDQKFWADRNRFPHLTSVHIDDYEASRLENTEYQEHIHQQLISEKTREKWGQNPSAEGHDSAYASDNEEEHIITNPDDLTPDHGEHPDKNTATYLDDSHSGLSRIIFIDDWPFLEELNLGDNYLSYLVVKKCPKLRILRYAHNSMKHDAFIDWASCPQLRPENVDKHNYNGKLERGYNSEPNEKNESKFQKKNNLTNVKENKFNTEIIQLMIKYQNNQITQAQFLAEIEQRQLYFKEFLNDFTREQLERLIGSLNAEAYVASPYSAPLWPWVGIGLSYLALLSVIIIVKRKILGNR